MAPNGDIDQLRRDLQAQGQSISAIVTEVRAAKDTFNEFRNTVETERKVRLVEDRHLNQRLDDIEASINTLNSLGKWILGAFGAALITALASFIINGGLTIVPHT